jgi:succinyl-diaminopimelate desuccinylase
MNENTFERIKSRIDSYENDMIQLQIDLTSIPALSPENGGDGEYEKAKFLSGYLASKGFKHIEEFNAPDERVSSGIRPNIVVRIPGKNPHKTVWIVTHTDIVPPGEIGFWDGDPYKGYVKEGKIFGRGTEDNQQDLVASVFAAKAFLDEGITPESSIGLIFVADEETASIKGLSYLLENGKDLIKNTDMIIVPDFGNKKGSIIEIAEKSILWLKFKTTGEQCHASAPSLGNNAFTAASNLVVELGRLNSIFDEYNPLFRPSVSTFEPTKKDANVPNINTIPGDDVFYLDCRVLPSYDLETVMSEIRKIANSIEKKFNVSIEITKVQYGQAPTPTSATAPIVTALKKAVKEVYGVDTSPGGIGGGTVAAHFRQKGLPAAVWCKLTGTVHQPNESCLIANMIGDAKVFAHLFLQ